MYKARQEQHNYMEIKDDTWGRKRKKEQKREEQKREVRSPSILLFLNGRLMYNKQTQAPHMHATTQQGCDDVLSSLASVFNCNMPFVTDCFFRRLGQESPLSLSWAVSRSAKRKKHMSQWRSLSNLNVALKRARLQLDYHMSSQFAGVAVALEKGLYAKRGLDLEILPLCPAGMEVETVLRLEAKVRCCSTLRVRVKG
jgi:hypothetical protein